MEEVFIYRVEDIAANLKLDKINPFTPWSMVPGSSCRYLVLDTDMVDGGGPWSRPNTVARPRGDWLKIVVAPAGPCHAPDNPTVTAGGKIGRVCRGEMIF